jgi:N-acetyl-alpha-D-glucosaminyl L-malate synthase BshA
MRIGVLCYASVGGSGVVATELAHALALRGHEVHLISSELPFRWRHSVPLLSFERVHVPEYPLFREPQYLLALTNSLVRVARERHLDILHAHYAVPHATAAYLAHQILSSTCGVDAPRTVTTLHGTDITLVGSDPSYASVVAFSIERSHGVTAVSESLRLDTIQSLGIERDIRVVPNFLDCSEYRRLPPEEVAGRLPPHLNGRPLIAHISNFRPVKRVDRVIEVFRRINEVHPSRLVMIGDGPERGVAERRAEELGLGEAVEFLGEQLDLVSWLSAAQLFLLPSSKESFGMAALEAMACEVPVVASRVGGLPEIIDHGVTGFLCEPDDLDGMARAGLTVLADAAARARIGRAAAEHVRSNFCTAAIVPQYESYYAEVLSADPASRVRTPC